MIELLTTVFVLIQLISIVQRKGFVINFNRLQLSLRVDLNEILEKRDDDFSLSMVLNRMFLVSVIFYFFYFSYFFYIFLQEIISVHVFIIAMFTVLLSTIYELLFYKKFVRNLLFKESTNNFLSITATINSVLQLALITSIILNFFR